MNRERNQIRKASRGGILAAAAAAVTLVAGASYGGGLTHRYSFDGNANDSVGTANGTLYRATISGGRLVLANTGTSGTVPSGQYLDLPNNIAKTPSLTVEFWTTWNGGNNWQRFFDFGNTTLGERNATDDTAYTGTDYLFVSPMKGSAGTPVGSEIKLSGVSIVANGTAAIATGVEKHVAMTFDDASRTMTLYVDGNYVEQATNIAFNPTAIAMNNMWIGRSNFKADPFFNGSFDEFRIYDRALSAAAVSTSYSLGPNTLAASESKWQAASGSWGVDANWSAGMPTGSIDAVIDNGGAVSVDSFITAPDYTQLVNGSLTIAPFNTLETRLLIRPGNDTNTAALSIGSGATLKTATISVDAAGPAANKTILIDGGILSATGSFAVAGATTTVGAGGATFEVASGFTADFQSPVAPVSNTATLNKRLAGTLRLSGGGYEAPIHLGAGTLAITGNVGVAGVPLQLGDSAVLDGQSATLRLLAPATVLSPITVGTDSFNAYNLEMTGDATATVAAAITMNSALTVRNAATTGTNAMVIAGGISSASFYNNTLTFDNAGLIIVDTADAIGTVGIADTAGGQLAVVKNGSGTVRLMDANTYASATTINNGTLAFASPASIGGTGQSVLIMSDTTTGQYGVLGVGEGFDHNNLKTQLFSRMIASSEGVVALSANSAENLDFTDWTMPASVSLGALPGEEVIYTGTITPSGMYRLGGGGGTLYVGDPAAPVANRLTGFNSLVVGGGYGGTLVLTAPNDYQGGTTVQRGAALSINDINQIGTGSLTLTDGTLRVTGTAPVTYAQQLAATNFNIDVVDPAGSLIFTGGIGFTGGDRFHKYGEGAWVLSTTTYDVGGRPILVHGGSLVLADTAVMTTTGWTSIGQYGTESATMVVKDSATLNAKGDFNVSDVDATKGRLFLSDSAIINANTLYVGKNGTTQGAVRQTGGQFLNPNAGGDWRIGGTNTAAAESVGAWTMTGGVFTTSRNLQIGSYGRGIMTIEGGTATASTWPAVGRFAGAYGVLTVTGTGVFNQTGTGNLMIIGESGYGILNVMDGGTVNAVRDFSLGHGDNGTGFVNLGENGTIITPSIRRNFGGTNRLGVMNFHGGTLKAAADGADIVRQLDAAYVWSGGAVIDTDGKNVSLSQPLATPAGSGVSAITLASGGAGYIAHPVVEITGGGGQGASAVAVMDAGGTLTGIRVTNPGTGYTSAPQVRILGGGATTDATVDAASIAENASTGGLTKKGAGTLTLGGRSTYNGPTVISGGTLQLAATPTVAANWDADTIAADDGANVSSWIDSVGDRIASVAVNPPKMAAGAINGHDAVRFAGTQRQSLQVFGGDSPIAGTSNYSIAFVFRADAPGAGPDGGWWQNSGVIDAEEGGTQNDWGVVFNSNGKVGTGAGNPDRTLYSQGGLADGQAHVAIISKLNDVLTLNVDGVTTRLGGMGTAVRNPIRFTIGQIQTNANWFTGDIAQIMMFQSNLLDADIAALGDQLAAKYGSSASFGTSDILPVSTPVSITAAGAALDLNGRSARIGSLEGVDGSSVKLGAGTLLVGGNGASTTFAGVIEGAGGLVKEGAGTLTLSGTNAYTGPTNVNEGVLRITGSIMSTSQARVNGGTLAVPAGADPAAVLAGVAQLIQQGYGDGSWNGTGGISSDLAQNDPQAITGVAAILSGGDVLVKAAWYGDTDVNSLIDGDDYFSADNGFLGGMPATWGTGDFDSNGLVDGRDFLLMDRAYLLQPTPISVGNAAVPEPATLTLLAAATLLAGRRRRR